MPIVYCQLFSGETLLADRLLVFIEREVKPNKQDARGGTFRVPADQRTKIRTDEPLRLELPEKVARGLKIPTGTALPIVAQQIQGGVAQFGEAPVSQG
jgi:hypothetical protein